MYTPYSGHNRITPRHGLVGAIRLEDGLIAKKMTPNLFILTIQALKVDAEGYLKAFRDKTCNANISLILLTDPVDETFCKIAREYGVYIFILEWLLASNLSRLFKCLIDLKILKNYQSLCV